MHPTSACFSEYALAAGKEYKPGALGMKFEDKDNGYSADSTDSTIAKMNGQP